MILKHKSTRLEEVNQYADILWKLVCIRGKARRENFSPLEQKRYDRMIAKTQIEVLRGKR